MENNTEPTSEAPATTGAENHNASLTINDLASSFMEKVEEQTQDQSTIDSTEESDQEVVDSAEDQDGNVLSHNDDDTEEDSDEESDETEEVEESEEPKGLQKALKRINQLTARAKGAEEEVATLKQQIQSIQSQQSQQPTNQSDTKPALDKINNIADLETLRKEALSAKKWALSNLGRGEVIEVDGKEYDDDDIRNILTEAEEYLSEGIPQRAQFLQQKQQWTADTVQTFPWTEKGEGEDWETFVSIRENNLYKPFLDSLPGGDYITGLLVEGLKAVKAKQVKPKPKTKAKTPPSDLADAVAPPAENKQVRREKKRQAILSKPIGSEKDLAQYLQL